MTTSQLPSYEYDRRGDFACSRLPCCSTFNHIVSKTTRAKLKILGLFRPFHGELVHLQPSAHHGCLSVPWRIRSPAMEPRFEVKTCWERGAWGIHSARAVPAQCPRSARTVPATVPAWKTKQCPRFSRSWKESGSLYTHSRTKKTRALLCFPGGHCRGHCAGTARALRGHCVFPRRRVTSGRQAATPLATARGHALATYPKLSGKETTVRDE